MTAPTLAQFLERYPEFTGLSEAVVLGAINDAALDTPEDVWQAQHKLGVSTLAAHLLAIRQMQLSNTLGQQNGAVLGGASGGGPSLTMSLYGCERMRLWEQLPYMGIAY